MNNIYIFLKLLYFTNKNCFYNLKTPSQDYNEICQKFDVSRTILNNIIREDDFDEERENNIHIKYARVSTKEQLDNNSIGIQIHNISNYLTFINISKNDQFVISEYDSAWSKIPDMLYMMIKYLKNITICFNKYDRFSRNIQLFINISLPLLQQNNIKLLFLTDYIYYTFEQNNLSYFNLIQQLIPCQKFSEENSICIKKANKAKCGKKTIRYKH